MSSAKPSKYAALLKTLHLPQPVKDALRGEVESSEFALATLRHFQELDADGSHQLERAELKKAFAELLEDGGKEAKVTVSDVNKILAEFDEDQSGSISFTEYLEMAQYVYVAVAGDQGDRVVDLLSTRRRAQAVAARTDKYLRSSGLSEEAQARISAEINSRDFRKAQAAEFDRLDVDRNGKLDSTELAIALARIGRSVSMDVTKHSVDLALSEYDADGNGFLSKGEYIELAKCVHVTKEAGVTASGFSRYSAEAASDRNFKLAQKAFDVLSNVVEKRADDRTAETGQKVITFASVALVVVGAAAGYLIARSR